MECKVKEFDVYIPKTIVLRKGKIIKRYKVNSLVACFIGDTIYSQERIIDLKSK